MGYYSDGSLGLILATQRWYSPQLMRWMTRDPIEYEGGENLYGYVSGDPVSYVDPDGLDRIKILVETTKGTWKRLHVTFDQLVQLIKREKNIDVLKKKGVGAKACDQAWGNTVCHAPHGGKSKKHHFQPEKRRTIRDKDGILRKQRGHVYFDHKALTPFMLFCDDLHDLLIGEFMGELGEYRDPGDPRTSSEE